MILVVCMAAVAAGCAVLATGAVILAGERKPPGPGSTHPMAAAPPARPAPGPGPWRDHPCGCAIRRNPTDVLTCPAHAAHRDDILDLLLWADQMKDHLATGCACGATGWVATTAPDGTVTERACRDCLGPEDAS